MMTYTMEAGEGIFSELAADPNLVEFVNEFVNEIPARIAKLHLCADTNDWEGLRRQAHQLTSAASSYGFNEVPPLSARLEKNIQAGRSEDIIRDNVHELVDICSRLKSGSPAC